MLTIHGTSDRMSSAFDSSNNPEVCKFWTGLGKEADLSRRYHLQEASVNEGAEEVDDVLVVEKLDFWNALAELRPSLSAPELERYRQLREGYEGRQQQP